MYVYTTHAFLTSQKSVTKFTVNIFKLNYKTSLDILRVVCTRVIRVFKRVLNLFLRLIVHE